MGCFIVFSVFEEGLVALAEKCLIDEEGTQSTIQRLIIVETL
ncbi:hypothetical protein [Enterococcus rivorum]|nr:hypothetical protein [Enterococcus rivorum]